MINLLPVESSMIASVGYDPERDIMIVLFNNGKAYQYYDVPQEEYEGLLSAESKGSYMRQHVIDAYPYARFKGWRGLSKEKQQLDLTNGPAFSSRSRPGFAKGSPRSVNQPVIPSRCLIPSPISLPIRLTALIFPAGIAAPNLLLKNSYELPSRLPVRVKNSYTIKRKTRHFITFWIEKKGIDF